MRFLLGSSKLSSQGGGPNQDAGPTPPTQDIKEGQIKT